MADKKQLPDYADVISQLQCEKQPILAAEIHGFMTGVLCGLVDTHSDLGFKTVLARLKEEEVVSESAKTCLATLMLISAQQLQDANFSFQLLLPQDETPLSERIKALASWCQNFLGGVGLTRLPDAVLRNNIIKEAMHDIAEIGKTKSSDDLPENEAEASYFELAEFVRMAVLLIYTQCVIEQDKTGVAKNGKVH